MLSALLSHRVEIQQRGEAQDAIGQPVETWTTLATVWANVKTKNGIETIKSGGVMSVVQASIRIRAGLEVTPAMRVVHGATVYQVVAVLPDAGRMFVDLVVESIT